MITGFGRVGAWFASERYDIQPDLILSAKGLSSAYASIGAVIATDSVMQPFLEGDHMYTHGITFGGHPVQSAIALKNIEIMKRERIVEHVAERQDDFRATLEQLLDLPIVGDVRGTGFFYAIELVKDKETKAGFDDDECERLLRGFLSPRLFERGLICRADDRGDPVIQISPPLVAQQEQFDEMVGILGDVLSEAWDQVDGGARSLRPLRPRHRSRRLAEAPRALRCTRPRPDAAFVGRSRVTRRDPVIFRDAERASAEASWRSSAIFAAARAAPSVSTGR